MISLHLTYRTVLADKIKQVYPFEDFDQLSEAAAYLTEKQYKYLLALFYQKSPNLLSKFHELTNEREHLYERVSTKRI